MKKILLLTISVITPILATHAATPWWVNLGSGFMSGNNTTDNNLRIYPWSVETGDRDMHNFLTSNGSNFLLNYTRLPKKNQVLSIDYTQMNYRKDSFEYGAPSGKVTNKGYIYSVAVEYGLIQRWQYGHISIVLGPAFVNNRSAYNTQEWAPPPQHSGIGFSGKIETAIRPWKYAGFALSVLGNYNQNMPFYGIFLSLQVGDFQI